MTNMKLNFCPQVLKNNLDNLNAICKENGLKTAYMIKKEMMLGFILNVISGQKIYTTDDSFLDGIINIYAEDKDFVIVDAFDRREGITMQEAKASPRKTAIVNFFCCEKKIPKEKDLKRIVKELRSYGFENISFGGTMMLFYPFRGYDEIRMGEALLTGYSTVFNKTIPTLLNPFWIDCEVVKADKDRLLIKEGFLDIGGFTNYETLSVNTDWTVIKNNQFNYKAGDIISLCPDYYTLMKLAKNGVMNNVEIIR